MNNLFWSQALAKSEINIIDIQNSRLYEVRTFLKQHGDCFVFTAHNNFSNDFLINMFYEKYQLKPQSQRNQHMV